MILQVPICVLGNWDVGKTSLIHQYVYNEFPAKETNTDMHKKNVEINGEEVTLRITDTAGQEKFRSLTTSYYRQKKGFLLVFDISRRVTFESVPQWLADVRHYAPHAKICLVSNKNDLSDRQVYRSEASALATSEGIDYYETTASDYDSVSMIFESLASLILREGGSQKLSGSVVNLKPPASRFRIRNCCSGGSQRSPTRGNLEQLKVLPKSLSFQAKRTSRKDFLNHPRSYSFGNLADEEEQRRAVEGPLSARSASPPRKESQKTKSENINDKNSRESNSSSIRRRNSPSPSPSLNSPNLISTHFSDVESSEFPVKCFLGAQSCIVNITPTIEIDYLRNMIENKFSQQRLRISYEFCAMKNSRGNLVSMNTNTDLQTAIRHKGTQLILFCSEDKPIPPTPYNTPNVTPHSTPTSPAPIPPSSHIRNQNPLTSSAPSIQTNKPHPTPISVSADSSPSQPQSTPHFIQQPFFNQSTSLSVHSSPITTTTTTTFQPNFFPSNFSPSSVSFTNPLFDQQNHKQPFTPTDQINDENFVAIDSWPSLTDDCIISFSELRKSEMIGKGFFGEVFKGEWNGTVIAIKYLYRETFRDKKKSDMFSKEVEILKKLRHPRIVLFLGVSEGEGKRCIITEYMENGSLFDKLEFGGILPGNVPLIQRIAWDISIAMSYLHSKKIVHRDLTSKNILLDSQWTAKVADFGLSRIIIEDRDKISNSTGCLPWIAPEVYSGQPYTELSDVHSFGIILWELSTGRDPCSWEHTGSKWSALRVAHLVWEGHRPPIPQHCGEEWSKLIQRCWAHQPSSRPPFVMISETIRVLMSQQHNYYQHPMGIIGNSNETGIDCDDEGYHLFSVSSSMASL